MNLTQSRQFPLATIPSTAIPALFTPKTSPLALVREELEQTQRELVQAREDHASELRKLKRDNAKAIEAVQEELRLAKAALGYHRGRMAGQVLAGVIDNTGGKVEPIKERQVVVFAQSVKIWDRFRFPVIRWK